jgi:hypothetical protein
MPKSRDLGRSPRNNPHNRFSSPGSSGRWGVLLRGFSQLKPILGCEQCMLGFARGALIQSGAIHDQ